VLAAAGVGSNVSSNSDNDFATINLQRLKIPLEKAIKREDYELATKLRDEIRSREA